MARTTRDIGPIGTAARPEDGDGETPKALWGHSLAAAAVGVAIGATIVLVAIFGQWG